MKPQIMTIDSGLAVALSDYTVTKFQLPVPRFGPGKKLATVVELLSVQFYPYIEGASDVTSHRFINFLATSTNRTTGFECTTATMGEDLASPHVFAAIIVGRQADLTGPVEQPHNIDLTDSNGNGILIGGDELSFVMGDLTASTLARSVCKIKYRLVNIGIAEYVGIVQSQGL